jgi:hypothetical protein
MARGASSGSDRNGGFLIVLVLVLVLVLDSLRLATVCSGSLRFERTGRKYAVGVSTVPFRARGRLIVGLGKW